MTYSDRPPARPILVALSLVSSFGLACCGETEGEVIDIEVVLETDLSPIETETGYRIDLEQARIGIGPLRAYAPRSEGLARAVERLFVPVARAHGGEGLDGLFVRAEWLTPVAYDMLAEPTYVLGQIRAEAGVVEHMRVDLAVPSGRRARMLHGHHLWVRGTATRDGERLVFEGGLDLADDLEARIEDISFSSLLEDGGRWVLCIKPQAWFADAQFDRLEDGDGDGVHEITESSQVRSAWFLGARSKAGYEARFEYRGEKR